MRITTLQNYWRARAERFWHLEFLEYLTEELRFNPHAAAMIAHFALLERRGMSVVST